MGALELAVFRDELYFAGQRGDDDIELYKLDKDGVVRFVADINQNPSGGFESASYPSNFTVMRSILERTVPTGKRVFIGSTAAVPSSMSTRSTRCCGGRSLSKIRVSSILPAAIRRSDASCSR